MGRLRDNTKSGRQRGGENVDSGAGEFINPYSYESNNDARVQLELESRHLAFSYRYFDGIAPTLKKLIPAYQPEFTLREYKVVIVVVGGFFGSLPGALDQAALASVLLEKDGWKQVAWYEQEIKTLGVSALIARDLPQLIEPVLTGMERVGPYGHPLTMETRRRWLRGLALLRKLFGPKTVEAAGGRSVGVRRKFVTHHGASSDIGRVRAHRALHKPVD